MAQASLAASAGPDTGAEDAAKAARAARAAMRAARLAVPPKTTAQLRHLALDGLRTYRAALGAEEDRVSYWRRILQARIDSIRACEAGPAEVPSLRPALAAGAQRGRQALVRVVPVDDLPPMPDLDALWEAVPQESDEGARAALLEQLEEAERGLSAYRKALHQRIDTATEELIARYRINPMICLSVLPQQRRRG